MNYRNSIWTEYLDNKLVKLWREGKTGQEISDALGVTTRDAVIARARRLRQKGIKLDARPSPLGPKKIVDAPAEQSYTESVDEGRT